MPGFREERSAGFLVFIRTSPIRYLFLINKGRFDIPKGIIRSKEDELAGALRELREETGIDKIRIFEGFRHHVRYFYRREDTLVKKEVVYFLGEAEDDKVRLSHEHDGYSWMTKDEIMAHVKYRGMKEVVREAERLLTSRL